MARNPARPRPCRATRHRLLDHRYQSGRCRLGRRRLVLAQSRAPAAPRSAAGARRVLASAEAARPTAGDTAGPTAGGSARGRGSARRKRIRLPKRPDHAARHDLRTHRFVGARQPVYGASHRIYRANLAQAADRSGICRGHVAPGRCVRFVGHGLQARARLNR